MAEILQTNTALNFCSKGAVTHHVRFGRPPRQPVARADLYNLEQQVHEDGQQRRADAHAR